MSTRERHHEPAPRERPATESGATSPDALAQEGAAFAAAASDILNAALSGDSTAFLKSNQQLGGQ